MKTLLIGCGIIVALPVLLLLGFGVWTAFQPTPQLVSCIHIPYLRAKIGDTIFTIPRVYVERTLTFDDQYLTLTAGDLDGRCQTELDPPIPVESIVMTKNKNTSYELNNIGLFIEEPRFFLIDASKHPKTSSDEFKCQDNEWKDNFHCAGRISKNTTVSAENIFIQITTTKKKKEFERKVRTLLWALQQPPATAPITPEGDFDLQKLLEKEKTL